jgi:putative Mn2+ efflux pump MntP
MNALENLLIIAGISLDIFAAMECQGSLVAKIDKKQLVKLCALIAAWQMAALFVGSYLSGLLYRNTITHNEKVTGFVIAAAIFFCLGVRLVAKAIKNERIVEHCEQKLGWKQLLAIAAVTSIYTLLTGIAFGFLGTSLLSLILVGIILTVVCVVGGAYVGYHFGYEQKTKVYLIGGILLLIGGVDVIIRFIL